MIFLQHEMTQVDPYERIAHRFPVIGGRIRGLMSELNILGSFGLSYSLFGRYGISSRDVYGLFACLRYLEIVLETTGPHDQECCN